MQRRLALVLSLAALVHIGWVAATASAQETRTARGTVTAITGNVVTVKAGDRELKLTTDAKTVVTAEGAGTASRQAEAAGKKGTTLSQFIAVGNAVEVTYTETGGTMHATSIRRVADAGAGGGRTSDDRVETANGTVESISGNTITISGSGGGGSSFKQSFTVDNTTSVIAVGAGTASARGGKLVLTDYVGVGDRVTVSYHKVKDTLHAAEIRVREKAKK